MWMLRAREPSHVDGPQSQGIVDALRRCGLASADHAVRLEPLAGGVCSDIFVARLAQGRTVVVKRSIGRMRVAEEWLAPADRAGSEARWLRLARTIDPSLAPEVLAEDEAAHLFVMEWLDPVRHPVWKHELAAGRIAPAFAEQVGRSLALLHAATAGSDEIAAAFPNREVFRDLRISPFLLFTAERNPGSAPRLRALAARLAEARIALIHGDVSPKNILVGPRGPVFLDAETCVFGDPAFDLAFCLSHLLLKTVWLKRHREPLHACLRGLTDSYLAHVDWEGPAGLSTRAAEMVAALLLARVDGKSPAPYLVEAKDRDFVRAAGIALLADTPADVPALEQRWRLAWDESFGR